MACPTKSLEDGNGQNPSPRESGYSGNKFQILATMAEDALEKRHPFRGATRPSGAKP